MLDFVTIAQVGELKEGEGRAYQIAGRHVGLFLHQGEYFAIDDLCPHQGASLSAGYLDEDGSVTCPWHAWRFKVCDGTWCDNPRIKTDSFAVRVVDGAIQVCIPPRE